MLKKYLLLFIIFISIFGCKEKVSYEGTLIHRDDLPFIIYAVQKSDIFLKTSISDRDFPDGVRYYTVFPKDKYYQDFINNIGNKVLVEGEESRNIAIEAPMLDMLDISTNYTPEEGQKPIYNIQMYKLENAKIEKVY